ncbi:hypothetical protein LUZ60_015429 [Juncus effusus]|nr:hypothetical protein LUZ60_015429 [Juncus effusus]
MEAKIRKLQKWYKRAIEEMEKWDQSQSEIVSSFSNASSIINRLEVLKESKNYGALQLVPRLEGKLLGKQTESLEMIFLLMNEKLKEFESVVRSLDKISRDANQYIKSEISLSSTQMELRVGILPSFKICLDGLKTLREMHKDEFALKSAIISSLTYNRRCSSAEIADLQRLLIDQPNIPKFEVQSILDVIFAEEI